MALTIDTFDRHGLSNEVRHELKKSKVMLYFCSLHSNIYLTSCTLLTRRSASVLKVGVPCRLRSLKNKTWPIVFITRVLEYKALAHELLKGLTSNLRRLASTCVKSFVACVILNLEK